MGRLARYGAGSTAGLGDPVPSSTQSRRGNPHIGVLPKKKSHYILSGMGQAVVLVVPVVAACCYSPWWLGDPKSKLKILFCIGCLPLAEHVGGGGSWW